MDTIVKKSFYGETVLAIILTILLLLLVKPFNLIMDDMVYMTVLAAAIVVHIAKVILVWGEKPQDERDLSHRFYSSWISYISVSSVLIVGIAVQGSMHGNVDPWLPFALAMLFIGKLVSRIYLEIKY